MVEMGLVRVFFRLLDDIAFLARLAGGHRPREWSLTIPQYVHGIAAAREFPITKHVAIGSLRNKLLLVLNAAVLFRQFMPWLLTPVLMLVCHIPVLRRRREDLGQPSLAWRSRRRGL